MNLTMYLTDFTTHFSSTSLPRSLWDFYYQNLWDYEPESWVSRLANSSRVLAITAILPILILALLDISSYGIARSLGIIDDVKASTSDKATIHQDRDMPSILVHESTTPTPDLTSQSRSSSNSTLSAESLSRDRPDGVVDLLHVSQPDAYYASEDNNLKLSGVGVFSPATSQPGSPTLSRHSLHGDRKLSVDSITPLADDGLVVRRRIGAGQADFVDD